MKTFTDLITGDEVSLDANTFVYHFSQHPQFEAPCTQLMSRVILGELRAFTSTHIIAEAARRLMTLEACTLFGWPYSGIAQRLRSHPTEVRALALYRQAVEQIPRYGVQTLLIPPSLLAAGTIVTQQTGLLTNDAVVVAIMRTNGLTKLASHDADFDGVPGLVRYSPV